MVNDSEDSSNMVFFMPSAVPDKVDTTLNETRRITVIYFSESLFSLIYMMI